MNQDVLPIGLSTLSQIREALKTCNKCTSLINRLPAKRGGIGEAYKGIDLMIISAMPETGSRCVHGFGPRKHPQTEDSFIEGVMEEVLDSMSESISSIYSTFLVKCPTREKKDFETYGKMSGACRYLIEAECRLLNPKFTIIIGAEASSLIASAHIDYHVDILVGSVLFKDVILANDNMIYIAHSDVPQNVTSVSTYRAKLVDELEDLLTELM